MSITLRRLMRSPGFTLTAVATLAVGVAANLVIFAAVDAILLRPLPFPEADRLVSLVNTYPGAGVERSSASVANYFERRGALPALSSVALFRDDSITVGARDAANRVPIARVTPEFFATLGARFARGKTFPDDALSWSTDQVAVITDGFWRAHFHGDPDVVGKTFLNDGLPITVVGVLAPGFRFLSSRAQFFRPDSHDPHDRLPAARHNNTALMIGRLAPGHTLDEAQAQLDALNTALLATDPDVATAKSARFGTRIFPLRADHVREIRPLLLLLQCGAAVLLLIGTVNLVNLFLIRTVARARDLAVRRALGASRWALLRGTLAETLLVSLVGSTVGAALGAVGVRLLALLGAERLPLGATIAFDGRTAGAALALAVAIGGGLAIPVFWFGQRLAGAAGLGGRTRGSTGSRGIQRLRHAFIAVQLAMAFILLTSAGLLGVSLQRALDVPVGFTPDAVLTGAINLPWKSYPTGDERQAFIERLLPQIRALPGVTHAAIAFNAPFSTDGADGAVVVLGRARNGEPPRPHDLSAVTADYWGTLGIPLLHGRLLEEADNHRDERVCVVDAAFAHRYWPEDKDGTAPLGQRISLGFRADPSAAFKIVGVVGSTVHRELTEAPGHGTVYFPYRTFHSISFSLLVRTTDAPARIAPDIRRTLRGIDPGLPIDDLRPMRGRIDDTLVARRSPAILAAVFCAIALLLAAIGTYGVLAYAVSQREREIGVRMAIGALPNQIARQLVAIGLRLLGVGLILGLAGAWAAARSMQSVLFHVPSLPLGLISACMAAIGGISLLAIVLPAWRASRMSPSIALRSE